LKNYLLKDQLRELLNQKASNSERTILHYPAFLDELEIRETLWKILLNTFENREEMKDLIIQRDIHEKNFVHYFVKSDVHIRLLF